MEKEETKLSEAKSQVMGGVQETRGERALARGRGDSSAQG